MPQDGCRARLTAAVIWFWLWAPGDPRVPLVLHVIAPQREHALDQPAWGVDVEVLPFPEEPGGVGCPISKWDPGVQSELTLAPNWYL